MNGTECNQENCTEPGRFRYTWPGRDEAFACEEHAAKLDAVARALGCYVQLIPLNPEDLADEY